MKTPPGLTPRHRIEWLETRIAPAAAVLDLSTLNGVNGFVVNAAAQGDFTGAAVSEAGDINGDGFADFVITAPKADTLGGLDSGALAVIFGNASGQPPQIGVLDLNGTNGFLLSGAAQSEATGSSVSAGDVNGDGLSDLIIGAPDASPNGSSSGAVYVVFGRATFAREFDLSDIGTGLIRIQGEGVLDNAGFSVSSCDFNNDGKDDIVIGAPNHDGFTGAAYVVFGATSFPNPLNLSTLNLNNGFKVVGEAESDFFGLSVGNAGDINNDGFEDIVIGAPRADSPLSDTGAAYVIMGRSIVSAPVLLSALDGSNGFRIHGENSGDAAGTAVTTAGDVNGDGIDDLLIGAPFHDLHGENAGAAYVVYGKSGVFASALDLSSVANVIGFKIVGAAASELAGSSLSAVGDFNRDEIGDLIIGAPGAASRAGAAYLVVGSSTGFPDIVDLSQLNGINGFAIRGEAKDDFAGTAVSGTGDINGDGVSDIVIGARGVDGVGIESGRAYVIYGFDTRLTVSGDGKSATITEADGDIVTIQLSRGGLLQQDIVLAADGTIASLDLTRLAALSPAGGSIKPLNISINVKTPGGTSGDGLTKVGFLNADGVALGKLKLQGDLGRLVAGIGGTGSAAKNISILGNLGSSTGAGALSQIFGALGKLSVKGSFLQNSVQVDGAVKSVRIAGDYEGDPSVSTALLEGIAENGMERLALPPAGVFLAESIKSLKIGGSMKGGGITTTKDLGAFSVLGDLRNGNLFGGGGIKAVKVMGRVTSDDPNDPVTITARNKLGSLVINGDVENANILAGYNMQEDPVNPDATVGKVLVKGDWIASSLVAGIDDVTNDGFGRNDIIIAGDATPAISKIASVVIKGTASGTAAVGDHYGITAQQIGKVSIGGDLVPLTENADDILVDTTNNDFRVVEITAP